MPQELDSQKLDFTGIIRPGDHIVWGQGAGEPATLVEKLLEQRHRIGHASVFLGGVRSRRTLQREHADVLTFTSLGLLAGLVVVRTFLSWTLVLEIEGRWPWQRRGSQERMASGE